MMRMRFVGLTLMVAGTLVSLSACRQERGTPGARLYAALADAADETCTRYYAAVDAGEAEPSAEIPAEFWSPRIRDLKPVKFYRHRGNFVVVQKTSDGIEEGVYIYNEISSYFPSSGDDGFTFTALGNNMFQFKRRPGN